MLNQKGMVATLMIDLQYSHPLLTHSSPSCCTIRLQLIRRVMRYVYVLVGELQTVICHFCFFPDYYVFMSTNDSFGRFSLRIQRHIFNQICNFYDYTVMPNSFPLLCGWLRLRSMATRDAFMVEMLYWTPALINSLQTDVPGLAF